MRARRSVLIAASVAALAIGIPAVAQQGPESLLPDVFNEPPPPASTPTAPDTPAQSPTQAGEPRVAPDAPLAIPALPPLVEEDEEKDTALLALEQAMAAQRSDVPPAARRSLEEVGFLAQQYGGFATDAYGGRGGVYLLTLMRHVQGPLASRWGAIMTRRLLASRTASPANVAPQDWVAERVWLLLRMGEAQAARALAQEVDASRYNRRLYDVTMQAYLANGDIAGICPLVQGGVGAVGDNSWKMAQAVCASLAGEQGRATALLNQAQRSGWAKGIDYLLAEKAVGVGYNGRRAVKIEWTNVQGFNAWRHGLALATGVEVPDRLWQPVGRHVRGWRATAAMLTPDARLGSADTAAALGVLSGDAYAALYAEAAADGGDTGAVDARASTLGTAYAARDTGARVDAMRELWESELGNNSDAFYGRLVLTGRAASRIAPTADIAVADRDRMIAAMLAVGLDRQAARWAQFTDADELGWALLAVGRPGRMTIPRSRVDAFISSDGSAAQQKSKLLVAALAGLGRIDLETANAAAGDLETGLGRQNPWTQAIDQAARDGQQGTVALLAAAGLQGRGWKTMPAWQFYRLIRALSAVGLDAEARMIAAEAVTRA